MTFIFLLLYLFLLFIAWWLPALLFYGFGCKWLLQARERPRRAQIWLLVFVGCFAYTLYDGVYVKWKFSQRAKEFNAGLVSYNAPPSDVRAIQFHVSNVPGSPVDGQLCNGICNRLLFSGRFDTVIIGYNNPIGPGQEYRSYRLINQDSCKSTQDVDPISYRTLFQWQKAGRCVTEVKSETIDGRRFEAIVDREYDPKRPPWRSYYVTYIQLVDGEGETPIARAEAASIEFTYPLPVPGIFYHSMMNGLPTNFWPGFWTYELYYGGASKDNYASRAIGSREIISRVFDIPLSQKIPLPPEGGSQQ